VPEKLGLISEEGEDNDKELDDKGVCKDRAVGRMKQDAVVIG
jgi:hypothetical protein